MARALIRRADRLVNRFGPLVAYLSLAAVFGMGLFVQQSTRAEACRRFRGHDMPALAREWSQNFGEELAGPDLTPAEAERIERFIVRNEADLRRILPVSEC